MKRPIVGGLVSSLVFAMGCNNSAGPSDANATAAQQTKLECDHAPQVLFDPETGQMTILSDELRDDIRAHLGLENTESGEREATFVFRSRVAKAGDGDGWLTTEDHDGVNIDC